jgi:crossover junction endodeoxyribonuclease RusA
MSAKNKASWYKTGKGFGEDEPLCKCGSVCQKYFGVGGWSVCCEECNAKNTKRQREQRVKKTGRKNSARVFDKPKTLAFTLIYEDSITLTLPYPPSVNHYWIRTQSGGMRVSDAGNAFRNAIIGLCGNLKRIKGRVAVYVEARPPDARKRDLDNIFKALLDSLTHSGIIEDDCKIDDLHIVRCGKVEGGSVTVTVTQII